jgi:hypothetical protein
MKIKYLLDILIIFTNIFNFSLTMRLKCKPTTKQHLIDVMEKWFNLFVNQNHYQIMNSFKCVEKIKYSTFVCKAFPIYLLLIFLKYIILNIKSLSPFS